jgi:hypothetical protein
VVVGVGDDMVGRRDEERKAQERKCVGSVEDWSKRGIDGVD